MQKKKGERIGPQPWNDNTGGTKGMVARMVNRRLLYITAYLLDLASGGTSMWRCLNKAILIC